MALIKNKYRQGVFILVYRKEKDKIKYLLLKRKLHWKGWEFCKGGIEKGETELQAVKRELKEETHLTPIKVKNHKIKGKYKYQKPLADRPGVIGQTLSLFSAEVKGKKAKFDKKEHSKYKWFTYKKAKRKLTWQDQKDSLDIVNSWLIKDY